MDFVSAFEGLLIGFGGRIGDLHAQYTDPARRRSVTASPTFAPGTAERRARILVGLGDINPSFVKRFVAFRMA